jgi:hypothetical protein
MRWKSTMLWSWLPLLALLAALALAAASQASVRGSITLRATETLKRAQPGAHVPSAAGRFTISGAIVDKGTVTDRRTQKGNVATVRRVAVGQKGTITFVITIYLSTGKEPWTIAGGTGAYKGLHGKGQEVMDAWYEDPARFVMKGTVSQ